MELQWIVIMSVFLFKMENWMLWIGINGTLFGQTLREGVPVVSGLAVVLMDVYDHIVVNIPGVPGILWGHLRFQEFDGPFSPWWLQGC